MANEQENAQIKRYPRFDGFGLDETLGEGFVALSVPLSFLRSSIDTPSVVVCYLSGIRLLFVRYLFGREPDKYRTSAALIPHKTA